MGKNKNQFVRDCCAVMGLRDETSDEYIRTADELHKLTIEQIIMKKKEILDSNATEEPVARSFMDRARGVN